MNICFGFLHIWSIMKKKLAYRAKVLLISHKNAISNPLWRTEQSNVKGNVLTKAVMMNKCHPILMRMTNFSVFMAGQRLFILIYIDSLSHEKWLHILLLAEKLSFIISRFIILLLCETKSKQVLIYRITQNVPDK